MPNFTGLVIATPAFGGQVTSPYLLSMMRTVVLCCREGITHQLHVNAGDSLISRARALLLAEFLRTDASHLLWVDADMSWEAEDVVRLLRHDQDFVCGAYRQKREQLKWNFCLRREDGDKAPYAPEAGLIQIGAGGLGFTLVKRRVVERLVEAHPERAFTQTLNDGTELPCWDLFGPVGVVGDAFYGEDVKFCNYWTELGGAIWLDPAIQLGHHGMAAFVADPRSMFGIKEGQCVSP
jgi:hypothetical protein